MQDRYTGDIGDFGKLGLLRQLQRNGLTIGINWYRVPNEGHNCDGRFTDYVHNPEYARCDPELWHCLGEIIDNNQREIAALETGAILPAKWYSRPLDFSDSNKADRKNIREKWHSDAVKTLEGSKLIFLDPDNGLICESARDTKKSNKYILVEELADYYNTGASVVYYQHQARREDGFYRDQHERLLSGGRFPEATAIGLKFTKTSLRYYFFIVQPQHKDLIYQSLESMLETDWEKYFRRL